MQRRTFMFHLTIGAIVTDSRINIHWTKVEPFALSLQAADMLTIAYDRELDQTHTQYIY
jgi:hypothetical protein